MTVRTASPGLPGPPVQTVDGRHTSGPLDASDGRRAGPGEENRDDERAQFEQTQLSVGESLANTRLTPERVTLHTQAAPYPR